MTSRLSFLLMRLRWHPDTQWWDGGIALHFQMTSSNGNIFRVTGPLCGEFTGPGEFPTQRPVTRSFDVFFDLRLSKQRLSKQRLSKQPWGWWFETPSWSLWRQCRLLMHRKCVTHVTWCMSGSLTRGGGQSIPGIPGAWAPAILRIW